MESADLIAGGIGIALVVAYFIFVILMLVLSVVIACRIVSRAGFPWPLGLLFFVPVANLILLIILAFTEWPVQQELRLLKAQLFRTPKNEPDDEAEYY